MKTLLIAFCISIGCGLDGFAQVQMYNDSLVGNYPFSGNAQDVSGEGNHGTVSGTTLVADRFGHANRAYSFTGGSGIALPNVFNVSTMTLCAWVNTTTEGKDRTIFTEYKDIPNTFKIIQAYKNNYIEAWLKVGTDIYTPKWFVRSADSTARLNKWNFVSVVIDGIKDTASIYVNGVFGGVAKMNGYTPANLSSLSNTGIGHSYDVTTDQYEGSIDDIQIYSRVLDVTEIRDAQLNSHTPGQFSLYQNYPNPFNPSTTIRYGLPNRSKVTLTVFNTLGQQVAQLVNGELEAGYRQVQFDGRNLSSGVYFYRIEAGSYVETRKLVLMK